MKKILLAIGFRQLEEYLQKHLKNEFKFVGGTVYREGVIRSIGQQNPDIVVIRETLEGKENILSIVYEIRSKFPKIRVVFIGGKRDPGDVLLATLVSYGVYDILHGDRIPAQDVVALIREANEYRDVQHLQPKPIFDERKNKVLFESPDLPTVVQGPEKVIEKVIEKVVYIDGSKGNDDESSKTTPVEETPAKTDVPDLVKEDPKETAVVEEVKPPIAEVEKDTAPAPELKGDPNPIEPSSEQPDEKPKQEKKSQKTQRKEAEEGKSGGIFSNWFNGGGKAEKAETVTVNGKQKILTFMGAKSGLGNSTIALNAAVQLAQRKNRVIYIEMNDKTPSVNYWYELGHLEDGIDTALKSLEVNNIEKIKRAIIHSTDLAKQESTMQKNYKKFPATLDFMFFSNHYLTRTEEDTELLDMSLTKDLYLFLLFQMEYDYIILDVPSDLRNVATLNALVYSNKTFLTITQDVSSIGNALYLMNELTKRSVDMQKKTQFIVNRYEKAELDVQEIIDWIKVEDLITVPCSNKDFIDANFIGLPITLYSKNTHIKSAFQKLEKKIL